MRRRLVLTFLAVLVPQGITEAATIHVPAEQPTIQAGVDAASPGDTVLVFPGTYAENVKVFEPGIIILGSGCSDMTTIQGVPGEPPISSVVTFFWPGFDDTAAILDGFTIRPSESQPGVTCARSTTITHNVIIGGVQGIYMPGAGELRPRITHNTIAQSTVGMYLASDCQTGIISHNIVANCSMTGIAAIYTPPLSCNDVWGNSPNYGGFPDPTGFNGNISEDPLFCDTFYGDYSLHASSPCTHGYGCDLIGALGVGCGGTAVEPCTWGLVKSLCR